MLRLSLNARSSHRRLRAGRPGVGEEPADDEEPGEERQDHLHDVSSCWLGLALSPKSSGDERCCLADVASLL
jgi:hypothetical protein